MDISPDQLRAARAMLRLEQAELARRADVSVVTLRRLEAGSVQLRVSHATLTGVRQVLEAAGVEFIAGGVRRRGADGAQALFERLRRISVHSAEVLDGHDALSDADLYDEDGLPG